MRYGVARTGRGRFRRMIGGTRGFAALLACLPAFAGSQLPGQGTRSTPGRVALPPVLPLEEAPPEEPAAAPSESASGTSITREVSEIHLHSGEFHHAVVDLRIRGRAMDLVWKRTYRSRLGRDTALGQGWDFSYNLRIEASGQDVRLYDGNGRADVYARQSDGTYTAKGFFREGTFEPDGTFTLLFADMGMWRFRPLDASPLSGRVQSIADRNGNSIGFAYEAATGHLSTITDTLGRSVTLGWSGGRIASVTDFAGRAVVYTYDAAGNLVSVRTPVVTGTPNGNDFPLGKTTAYTYSSGFPDDRLNHNLLTITDPRGNTWLANQYGTADTGTDLRFDRVLTQQRGSPSDLLKFVYLAGGMAEPGHPRPLPLTTIVNDRVGNVSEHAYDARGRLVRLREFTGRADPALPTTATSNRPQNRLRSDDPVFFETLYAYDENSLSTQTVHPDGNVTRRVYELELEPAAPWRMRGNLRELWRLPGSHPVPGDQPDGVVERFEYLAGYGGCCGTSFVTSFTDARGNVTGHDYDAFGNRTQTMHPAGGGVEDWTYDAFGRETSHTLADDGAGYRRRDEKHYYGPSDGAQNGYLREQVVDAADLSLTTHFVYDAVGNPTSVTDPRGNDTQYLYNALDQVVRERSKPLQGTTTFRIDKLLWYDGDDNVTRIDVENRNELGTLDAVNPAISTEWDYGVLDEVLRQRREVAAGQFVTTEFAYDGNRNRTLVREGEAVAGTQPDEVVQTLCDERDLVWRVIRAPGDPSHATVQRDYDGNGNLAALRDGIEDGGHLTTYEYDALGRRVLETDAMGNVLENHYDPNGNLGGRVGDDASDLHPFAARVRGEFLDVPGSAGNVRLAEVMHQYDAMDRRIRTDERHFDTQTQAPILDGQSTRTWTYGPSSLLRSETGDGPAQVTSYDYDHAGRRKETQDALGNTSTLVLDANGNIVVVEEIDLLGLGAVGPQSVSTTYAYDSLDRPVLRVDAAGNPSGYAYDSRGNRVQETDPRGNDTRYVYDGLDRLVVTQHDMNGNGVFNDPLDIVLPQDWDDSSRKKSESDDNGGTTRYAYDALDRLIVTQHPDGSIDQAGSGATWAPGALGPDLGGFTPGYGPRDEPKRKTDRNGTRTDYVYDGLDRLVSKQVTRAPSVLGTTLETYQYDGLSRPIRAQDDDSLVVRGSSTTNGYDSLWNVLRETQQVLPGGPQRTVTAEYDGNSDQTRLVYPGGRAIVRTYDALDRPTLVRDDPPGAGTTIATYGEYLGPARLSQRTYGNGVRTEITYDTGVGNLPGDFGVRKIVRIEHFTYPGGVILDERTYQWDRAGNKTQSEELSTAPVDTRSYQYDAADRLTDSSSSATGQWSSYALDGAGNRTWVVGSVDPGTYTCNSVDEYVTTPFDTRTYDANGNLRTTSSPSRTFWYDYRNQLVQCLDGSSGQVTTYRYDCFGRRIERNVAGTVRRSYHDGTEEIEEQTASGATTATYAYSKGLDGRLQVVLGGTKYYCLEDDLGNVVAITDASGAVVESYRYGDFGTPEVVTPSSATSQPADLSAIRNSDSDTSEYGWNYERRAESFVPAESLPIRSVRWWGGYDQSPSVPSADAFVFEIYADAGGIPESTPIYSYSAGDNVARTATGQVINGWYDEYEYTATLPSGGFPVTAGVTYWLAITNDTPGYYGSSGWETSSSGDGDSKFRVTGYPDWFGDSVDLAFEVEQATAPVGNPFLFGGTRYQSESGTYWGLGRGFDPRVGRFSSAGAQGNVLEGSPYTFAGDNPISLSFACSVLSPQESVKVIKRRLKICVGQTYQVNIFSSHKSPGDRILGRPDDGGPPKEKGEKPVVEVPPARNGGWNEEGNVRFKADKPGEGTVTIKAIMGGKEVVIVVDVWVRECPEDGDWELPGWDEGEWAHAAKPVEPGEPDKGK